MPNFTAWDRACASANERQAEPAPRPPVPHCEAASIYTCECGSSDVDYIQKQTRGADEAMTTFLTCNACGTHWKE